MTWNAFNRRADVLRAVTDTADVRLDGRLPEDVPGVAETFADARDLVGALLLRWHTRLSGNIERIMTNEPLGLEVSVTAAWRETAQQMPGVRLVLDRVGETHPDLEPVLERAREREWSRLALSAGLASQPGAAAAQIGRRIEDAARAGLVLPVAQTLEETPVQTRVETPAETTVETPVETVLAAEAVDVPTETTTTAGRSVRAANEAFVRRLKAVLAA